MWSRRGRAPVRAGAECGVGLPGGRLRRRNPIKIVDPIERLQRVTVPDEESLRGSQAGPHILEQIVF